MISSGDYSLEIACDTVCLAMGVVPSVGLPYLTGCELRFDGSAGGYAPAFNSHMQTSIEGVFVAGDVCGIADEETAKRQGARAGRVAAGEVDVAAESPVATHQNGDQSEVGILGVVAKVVGGWGCGRRDRLSV